MVRRHVARPNLHAMGQEYSQIIDELTRATEILGERPSTIALRQVRRSRDPLARTRNRCLRELKSLFGSYLSGDSQPGQVSAVSLGQIHQIGRLLEAENPENPLSDLS
ncbi:hypothetical protein FWG86_00580 [Candidatus Saccharibacteria bacterium]|nr:hypothetical protein [Candidatus Saccharibacteria bacterium]